MDAARYLSYSMARRIVADAAALPTIVLASRGFGAVQHVARGAFCWGVRHFKHEAVNLPVASCSSQNSRQSCRTSVVSHGLTRRYEKPNWKLRYPNRGRLPDQKVTIYLGVEMSRRRWTGDLVRYIRTRRVAAGDERQGGEIIGSNRSSLCWRIHRSQVCQLSDCQGHLQRSLVLA